MHIDIGLAVLICAVLFLLAFSPWFRRFALVCVALMVVAGGVGVGYMKIISWQKEQAMTQRCSAPLPADSHHLSDPECTEWLAEHPQAKDMAQECSITASANRQDQIARAERAAKGLPPLPLPPGDVNPWPDLKELRETNIACKKWLADHPQAKD
jgi:hypothetical protein